MASPKYSPTVRDVAAALKKRYRDYKHYNLTGMANVPPMMKKLAMRVSPLRQQLARIKLMKCITQGYNW